MGTGARGFVQTAVAFACGYLAVALPGMFVVRALADESAGGFAGLALVLSLVGYLRMIAIAVALLSTYIVLRRRALAGAGATTVLTLAAWWIVTSALQLLPRSGWRGQAYITLAVALAVAPLVGRAAALAFPQRRAHLIALPLSGAVLVASSFVSSTIRAEVSDRAFDDLRERDLAQDQIDFTPYVATWLPPEVPAPTSVLGPITAPELSVVYGYNENYRALLTQARTTAGSCTDRNIRGYTTGCSVVAELDDGTAVLRVDGVDERSVWLDRDGTTVILQCMFSPELGCIQGDGTLDPKGLRILESLVAADYTPPEPLTSDDPVLAPLGPPGSVLAAR